MNKPAKLALIFGVGGLVASLAYYFLVYKPKKDAEDKKDDETTDDQTNWLTGGGNNSGNNNAGGSTTSVIGKSAYANKDGVLVIDANTGATVRTKNKNEFIGIITGTKKLAGKDFYLVAGGAWAVYAGFVKF